MYLSSARTIYNFLSKKNLFKKLLNAQEIRKTEAKKMTWTAEHRNYKICWPLLLTWRPEKALFTTAKTRTLWIILKLKPKKPAFQRKKNPTIMLRFFIIYIYKLIICKIRVLLQIINWREKCRSGETWADTVMHQQSSLVTLAWCGGRRQK